MSPTLKSLSTGAIFLAAACALPLAASAQNTSDQTRAAKSHHNASASDQHRGYKSHGRHHRRHAFGRTCGPRAKARGERFIGLIEDVFTLKADQQTAFNDLKQTMAGNRANMDTLCDSLPKKADMKKAQKED